MSNKNLKQKYEKVYKDGKEELSRRIIGYKNPKEFMENINK